MFDQKVFEKVSQNVDQKVFDQKMSWKYFGDYDFVTVFFVNLKIKMPKIKPKW